MPQREEPPAFFFRNGHLKTSSQHAPQRLHSPRRSASAAIVSSLRKLVMTKRRSLPWACRARSFAPATLRERIRRASRFRMGEMCESELCYLLIQLKVLFGRGRPGIVYQHSVALDLLPLVRPRIKVKGFAYFFK